MNMIIYLIIGIAIVSFVVIKLVTIGLMEDVNYAFVEDPDGEGKTVSIKKDRNKTIHKEGNDIINLSGYDKFIIHGNSLEKVGLLDGAFIFTKELKDEPIDSICNHFVVYDYDKERHDKKPVEGYRVRQAVAILPTKLDHDAVMKKLSEIIDNDNDIKYKTQYVQLLLKKYKCASEKYKDEDELIVSITYRNGKEKDYSFHPEQLLHGVVKYKSVD